MEDQEMGDNGADAGGDPTDGLIQQFSCMGTTDKEVLIKQLQKIVGPQMNSFSANFWLDMNNWNLQLAVGAYFDMLAPADGTPEIQSSAPRIIGSTTAYSCAFSHSELNLNIVVNQVYKVTVEILNNGQSCWPLGSSLRYIGGHNLVVNCDTQWATERISLNPDTVVAPKMTLTAEIPLLSSTACNTLQEMQWQMICPDGYLFGPLLIIRVRVGTGSEDEFVNQFKHLST